MQFCGSLLLRLRVSEQGCKGSLVESLFSLVFGRESWHEKKKIWPRKRSYERTTLNQMQVARRLHVVFSYLKTNLLCDPMHVSSCCSKFLSGSSSVRILFESSDSLNPFARLLEEMSNLAILGPVKLSTRTVPVYSWTRVETKG